MELLYLSASPREGAYHDATKGWYLRFLGAGAAHSSLQPLTIALGRQTTHFYPAHLFPG